MNVITNEFDVINKNVKLFIQNVDLVLIPK